ncbi:hypothetical protein TKK_0012508 [Trichogramma kaykai]|uniref:Uncharacterized protein n=1 Tax=Trichogramma kaykai TaxID=54128 RepID=A0ABD2WNR5_9HYME
MIKITSQNPAWQNLTEEEQKQASEYGRFTITGKLYRMVPVLMNALLIRSFNLVLKTRKSAGVKSSNPYIFGLPSLKKNKYIAPGPLFVEFSKECGAKTPSNLRGTPIRKNLATHILNKKADDGTVKSTANFMGHAKGIHEGVYQDHTVTDILLVSKSLESAVGKTDKKGTEKTKPIVKETVIKGKKKTEKKKVESETSMDSSQISLDVSVPRRTSKRTISKLKLTSKLNFSDKDIGTSDESPPKKKSKKSLLDKKKNKKRSDSDEEYYKKSQSSESDDSSHSHSNNREIKKKPRWSEDDKFKLCEVFIASMKMKKAPSNAAIRLAITNHEFLRNKNEATIRTFIMRILNTPEMYSKYVK